MTRYNAIKNIMNSLPNEDIVISSCGYISREVYRVKDRDRNFYMLGSMGQELAFGLGLAYARRDLLIIVISGDGSALMSLNTKALQNHLICKGYDNFLHVIIDNGCYESTGGQPTCSRDVDFKTSNSLHIEVTRGGKKPPRIPLTPKQIRKRFENAIRIGSTQ